MTETTDKTRLLFLPLTADCQRGDLLLAVGVGFFDGDVRLINLGPDGGRGWLISNGIEFDAAGQDWEQVGGIFWRGRVRGSAGDTQQKLPGLVASLAGDS